MELNYKDLLKAMSAIEDERKISSAVIVDALKEAMAKAYKKDVDLNDIDVQTEIDEGSGHMHLFQYYTVTDDVQDDELEVSLEDAKEMDPSAEIGGKVRREVEISSMSRAAATLARNVVRQKIREAEKSAVYDEYIDKLNDMVLGIVESVQEKYALINLGKAVAMMPKSAEIPGERLVEGQKLRVVITEVSKDTKGSQVLVSRADSMLVKRLFEKEVPEIFQGIVEIKAIAREPGERTKMAVMTHNDEVDPIGACIGPRGSRVQEIIEELHNEKIDIFQWSDDITELVKNALAPAEVINVLPTEDENGLLVIVDEDQLSLAIGKRGKNARLAVKLVDRKIDIKTKAELAEMGKDYDQLLLDAEVRKEQMRKKRAQEEIARMEEENRQAEEKRQKALAALAAQKKGDVPAAEPDNFIPEEMQEAVSEKLADEMAVPTVEKAEEKPAEVKPQAEEIPAEETAEETAEENDTAEEPEDNSADAAEEVETVQTETAKPKRKKADLENMKTEYVSVFEKLANTSKPKPKPIDKLKKKKRKGEEDEIKTRNKDLEKQLGNNLKTDIKPVYTEEELDEIQKREQEEEDSKFDFDYDDYEDYYMDEEK